MNFIYSILNRVTLEVYIGQTNCPRKRFSLHRRTLRDGCHCNPYLQRSYNKHGSGAFAYDVIEECQGFEDANTREEFHISSLRAKGGKVYNLREGGRNGALSQEHKDKIRKALLGRPKSDEAKARMSAAKVGKKQTAEFVAKRIKGRVGYRHSQETKLKIAAAHLGRPKPRRVKDEG